MRFPALLAIAVLVGCGGQSAPSGAAESPAPAASGVEAEVEAAVRKHLSRRSDLDMSAMDMSIENVDVQGDTAVATVGFEVKGNPQSGMSMQYNLAKENGEWVVQAKPAGHVGTTPQTAPSQGMPPNHPPAGGGQSGQELPPNHPPVAQ
jgi:hypothetical protein